VYVGATLACPSLPVNPEYQPSISVAQFEVSILLGLSSPGVIVSSTVPGIIPSPVPEGPTQYPSAPHSACAAVVSAALTSESKSSVGRSIAHFIDAWPALLRSLPVISLNVVAFICHDGSAVAAYAAHASLSVRVSPVMGGSPVPVVVVPSPTILSIISLTTGSVVPSATVVLPGFIVS